MPDQVQPTYAVTVQPRVAPGAGNAGPPLPDQLAALNEIVSPAIAERLLGAGDEVMITLRRTQAAEVWVPIEGPEEAS